MLSSDKECVCLGSMTRTSSHMHSHAPAQTDPMRHGMLRCRASFPYDQKGSDPVQHSSHIIAYSHALPSAAMTDMSTPSEQAVLWRAYPLWLTSCAWWLPLLPDRHGLPDVLAVVVMGITNQAAKACAQLTYDTAMARWVVAAQQVASSDSQGSRSVRAAGNRGTTGSRNRGSRAMSGRTQPNNGTSATTTTSSNSASSRGASSSGQRCSAQPNQRGSVAAPAQSATGHSATGNGLESGSAAAVDAAARPAIELSQAAVAAAVHAWAEGQLMGIGKAWPF